MRKLTPLCTSLIAIGLLHNSVLAQDSASVTSSCAAHLNTSSKAPTIGVLLSCLAEMQREIEKLGQGIDAADAQEIAESAFRDLDQRLQAVEAKPTAEIPTDAVVAFDLPVSKDRPNGCPEGWSQMSEFEGRVIVGASTNRSATFGYRAFGGEEKHQLTVNELPTHQHGVYQHAGWQGPSPNSPGASGGDNKTRVHGAISGPAGNSRPHNNMPPYLALYFCKKD